jgi:hypothetical protein
VDLKLEDLCLPCPACSATGTTPHPSGMGGMRCHRCQGRKSILTPTGNVLVHFLNSIGVRTENPPDAEFDPTPRPPQGQVSTQAEI